MNRLPLLLAEASDAPLFRRRGVVITRGQFAAAALSLAERLPASRPLLNRCTTRYGFTLTLVAAALRGQRCLLQGAEVPVPDDNATSVGDDSTQAIDLLIPPPPPDSVRATLPDIDADLPLAVVYTSGSTGQPQPHAKTWRSLWHAGRQIGAALLHGIDGASIVATVPMHHMYGLETSVALPLATRHAADDARPAFPEDVRRALAAVPAPRVLVTAPVHIRALLEAGVRLPPLARIISATAPLPMELALRAEGAFDVTVQEIYGCTEAGSIAVRRSVDGPLWTPLAGLRVVAGDYGSVAHGEHLAEPVALHDIIEFEDHDATRFRLLGRSGDVIKVGGKRASLGDLSHKLLSIPGVVDAVVFLPGASDDAALLQRPAALVVAPQLSDGEILNALSRLIDPVFLPRPLRRVPQLPRNATGKLTLATLQRLLTHA